MASPLPSRNSAAWQDAERERAFWQEHHGEFLHTYPDQFVAVKDDRVVAVSYDLRDLIADLRQQGLEPTDVWLHFFATATHAAL
ncbi:MAG: DUF5678 domain-containing protein [Dehalococcoidia bacterium]